MQSGDHEHLSSSRLNPFHGHLQRDGNGQVASRAGGGHPPPLPFHAPDLHPVPISHAAFQLGLPGLDLIALEGPSCREPQCGLGNDLISAIFIVEGKVCVKVQNTRLHCGSGDCLIVPGVPLDWSSSPFSVVCLMFPREQMQLRIQRLHSQTHPTPAPPALASGPVSCRHGEGKDVASLIRALHLLLCVVSDLHSSCPVLLPHLQLGDQLSKLTAMLAIPQLRQVSQGQRARILLNQDSIIEELIDYIDSHLAEHLSLELLESQCHYSRRALQYAFRSRYGCTVTQWIRTRRLDLAHRRLSLGSASDSVGEIARACGYRSMSLFSIEFQQRFHVKPSVLLREAKARQALFRANYALPEPPEPGDRLEGAE
jgi:AraC-like DNA-binding protein